MKAIDGDLWKIQIKAPEKWSKSNQIVIKQFLDSIVVLDENDEVIEQGK